MKENELETELVKENENENETETEAVPGAEPGEAAADVQDDAFYLELADYAAEGWRLCQYTKALVGKVDPYPLGSE